MNEKELSNVLAGDLDSMAIDAYLAFKHDPMGIASLAAQLAPRHAKFDSVKQCEAALNLMEAAEKALIGRREKMVSAMSYVSVLRLARELSALGPQARKQKGNDLIAGPVVRRLEEIFDVSRARAQRRNAAAIDKTLQAAGSRTTIPMPDLPCGLEKALRFAADEDECEWSVMESAFRDFLIVDLGRDVALSKLIQDELKEERTQIASSIDNCSKEVRGTSQHEVLLDLKKRLIEIDTELERFEEARNLRSRFKPGIRWPKYLIEEADDVLKKDLSNPEPISRRELAWLCVDFYPFWSEHAATYIDRDDAAKRSAKQRSKKAKVSGKKGAYSNERKKWIERTGALIAYAQSKGGLPDPAKIPEFVRAFASSVKLPDARDRRTQKRTREFIGRMLALRDQYSDETEGLAGLSVDPEIFGECLRMLRDAFPKSTRFFIENA